jgi:hypothetical protein
MDVMQQWVARSKFSMTACTILEFVFVPQGDHVD